ncbi:DUF2285 domain-containing protein [Sphingomonas sp. BIUV-7]|uniref:DUF2285 domain-containing protein n=1 Tax=Sphingomonas natans TaxID=3063330 RepID=A0ABT8YEP8_9SPHN|nr:DUF2285 domain-containing protein [Sphingomonas sp. BIUV-7]MDO6416144.1 DUF2285 domain-containing protein [Sphingomonas sp. BIUV-7]
MAQLAPWLSIITDTTGSEHAVLSDGWRRIRIDVSAGSLLGEGPVMLHYDVAGVETAIAPLLTLRRLLHLCRYRRFGRALFPADRRMDRWLSVLRTHDALADGASQYEIACALFGESRIDREWRQSADALRSRVRRMVREARHFAGGGYRSLMRRSDPSP